MPIVWEVLDTPGYTVLKSIDSNYFYAACAPPSSTPGYAALALLCIIVFFILVITIVVSIIAGASIPEEYFNANTVVAAGVGMAIGCVGLLANQLISYDETIKMAVFEIIAMALFQIPHVIMVMQMHIGFFVRVTGNHKSFKSGVDVASSGMDSHPGLKLGAKPSENVGNNSSGAVAAATTADKVVEGVANDKLQCCYLKPGVFSRWSQKKFQYDPVLQLISLIDRPAQEFVSLKMPVAFNLADKDTTRLIDIARQETSSSPPTSFASWSPE